jgi:hypothetical protein
MPRGTLRDAAKACREKGAGDWTTALIALCDGIGGTTV